MMALFLTMSFTLEIFLVSERVSKTCIPIAAKFDGNWIPNLVHLCLSINKLIRSAAKFDGNWILNLSLISLKLAYQLVEASSHRSFQCSCLIRSFCTEKRTIYISHTHITIYRYSWFASLQFSH